MIGRIDAITFINLSLGIVTASQVGRCASCRALKGGRDRDARSGADCAGEWHLLNAGAHAGQWEF